MALSLEECVGHGSTDEDGVRLFHESIDDLNLIRNFRSAHDDDERLGGRFKLFDEEFELELHEHSDGGIADVLGDPSGGSVGAVGGAEGVVYEDIGELAEGSGEGGVVCGLACVEADVFEQEDVAGRKCGGGFLSGFSNAIFGKSDVFTEQARKGAWRLEQGSNRGSSRLWDVRGGMPG